MIIEKFKPLLGKDIKDKNSIKFPCYVSTKLDGIRCIFKDGRMISRSLKEIKNKQLQEQFEILKLLTGVNEDGVDSEIILDGELYSHELTFQEINSVVMSHDKEVPESLKFHIFDIILDNNPEEPFKTRYEAIIDGFTRPEFKQLIIVVQQTLIENHMDIQKEFERVLVDGYEGLIIRNLIGKYKFGRSTEKEGLLLKMKPFKTFDAKIIQVYERFENANESFKNELGQSTKRNTKDAKIPTGIAAVFEVRYGENFFKVSLTGTEAFRKEIWENKESYIGKTIEYRAMMVGAKDVPRHAQYIRFRSDKD